MGSVLHGSARTTPCVRAELQASQESSRALAARYGLNEKTVRKWRGRDTTDDAPMGPKVPKSTVLTPAEEAIVVAFRQKTLLPLDDVLGCLKNTIPHLSRSALHRCLQRHGISRLPVEETAGKRKRFKTYEIGYVHIDSCELRHADASRHAALSWRHALKIEAQLRQEVAALTVRAEAADQTPVEEGLDIPAEIARREQRLLALEVAKAKIQARAQERFEAEQRAFEEIKARRQAKRDTGKNPSGQEPKPPAPGPKDSDQVNLTDEDSRIMPRSGGGFDQCYNAQATVDAATMLVVATHLTQAPNDKRQDQPALDQLAALPKALGQPTSLLADTGYFSAANVAACHAARIEPMIARGRQAHHMPVFERFAADTPPPDTDDPVLNMAHRLTTRGGKALYGLRKQTVEPVFGIIKRAMGWRRMSMRGLKAAQGEWALVTMAWNVKRLNALRLV